jgi:PPOX class probable F420-dependent enzyme
MATLSTTFIPESHLDLLESRALAHVATIGPRGEPQVNPVWFDWDGEYLRIAQAPTRQKYRNLQRDPRIALSIVDPANPHRYLEIRGRVVRFEPDPERVFLTGLVRKYTGADTIAGVEGEPEAVVIEPLRTSRMG